MIEILNRAGGPVKTGIALDGRKLLHIHLRTVTTNGQVLRCRAFRLLSLCLLENESHRAESKRAILGSQFVFDAYRAVSRVYQSVSDHRLLVGIGHSAIVLFRGAGLVLTMISFGPFHHRLASRTELVSELGIAKLARCIQALNLLTLVGRQSSIFM